MTGLKVIDGTPTAISKYLREKDKIIEKNYWKGKCKNQFAHAICFKYKGHKGRHKSRSGDCEW